MEEKRYHIEVEPGCVGTFSTPNPSPETLRILKDVIRMAMEKEALSATGSEGERSEVPPEGRTEPREQPGPKDAPNTP